MNGVLPETTGVPPSAPMAMRLAQGRASENVTVGAMATEGLFPGSILLFCWENIECRLCNYNILQGYRKLHNFVLL